MSDEESHDATLPSSNRARGRTLEAPGRISQLLALVKSSHALKKSSNPPRWSLSPPKRFERMTHSTQRRNSSTTCTSTACTSPLRMLLFVARVRGGQAKETKRRNRRKRGEVGLPFASRSGTQTGNPRRRLHVFSIRADAG